MTSSHRRQKEKREHCDHLQRCEMCINFLLEGFSLGREFYMTGLSICMHTLADRPEGRNV